MSLYSLPCSWHSDCHYRVRRNALWQIPRQLGSALSELVPYKVLQVVCCSVGGPFSDHCSGSPVWLTTLFVSFLPMASISRGWLPTVPGRRCIYFNWPHQWDWEPQFTVRTSHHKALVSISMDHSSQSTSLYVNRPITTKHLSVCQQTNHHKAPACMSTDQSQQNTCLYVNRPITTKHWFAYQSALHWMCEHVKVEINQRHYFSQSGGRKFQYKSWS